MTAAAAAATATADVLVKASIPSLQQQHKNIGKNNDFLLHRQTKSNSKHKSNVDISINKEDDYYNPNDDYVDDDASNNNNSNNKNEHALPQILTLNTILPSVSLLDAGDVIECYTLVRDTPLQSIIPTTTTTTTTTTGTINDSNNNNNNNNNNNDENSILFPNLQVRKSALAFRYKPNSSSSAPADSMHTKIPFELTLEYGPQRTGATQRFEAMPLVVHSNNNGGGYDDDESNYVTWENHGTLYIYFVYVVCCIYCIKCMLYEL